MASILLAEDDQNLGFMIKDNLEELGHEVHWAKDGESAILVFKKNQFDLCLLDIMMPKKDGFEVAASIRQEDEFIPILFLTAKSMEDDRLTGFEVGGDDYITKPFSMRELDYRINVFLRRSIHAEKKPGNKIIYFGQSSFDTHNLVYSQGEKKFGLTQMEAQLLKLLLDNENELVSREHILEEIWGENDYFKGRSLDVFITRLRKYLKNDSLISIKNHHGVGFCLQTKKADD